MRTICYLIDVEGNEVVLVAEGQAPPTSIRCVAPGPVDAAPCEEDSLLYPRFEGAVETEWVLVGDWWSGERGIASAIYTRAT